MSRIWHDAPPPGDLHQLIVNLVRRLRARSTTRRSANEMTQLAAVGVVLRRARGLQAVSLAPAKIVRGTAEWASRLTGRRG